MTEGINKNLVPPSKKTVNFLYTGLVLFYPENVFSSKEGKRKPVLEYWPEGGYSRIEFAKLLWNITKTNDTVQAAQLVINWKNLLDNNQPPEATVPENLDAMVSSLEENIASKKKLSQYDIKNLAKKVLLESEKVIEKPISAQKPEITTSSAETISKATGPLLTFAGKILTAPFRTAVYISSPATYSSSVKGEGPGVATARYMLAHGISSESVHLLESRAQQLGITPSQLRNLASLIKTEQEAHPFSNKWITRIYSGQKASLSQAQISSLLIPSTDGSTAVLPGKSFVRNVLGRIGQQLFGKLAKKALKTVGKKIATKIATTVATQAAASTVPVIGNIIAFVGQFILGKIKDFISSLKTKEGKEKMLTYLFGAMIIGGIFLGGPLGFALIIGGLVPGIGSLAAKAGGFGPLGTNIGSYGQAFMAGVTGVVFPSLAGPLIISFVSIPIAIAVILFIINSGAYIVPPTTGFVPGLIESPYIGAVKTASPADPFENDDLPITIEYTIKIVAKKGSLSNIKFEDECRVIRDGNKLSCPSPSSVTPEEPESISPTESFSFSYSRTFSDSTFNDSLIVDTFTVTADVPEKQGAKTATTASVIIGNPPDECPNGWPAFGKLTQGAYASFTHSNAEAIDIGLSVGNTITARHTGVVRAYGNIGPYGKHVEVVSICDGKEFFSRYAHFSVISVKTGQLVTLGQTIGLSGNTGNSTGPHLHYEFRDPSGSKQYPSNPPYMMTPYIPKDLPRKCSIETCKTNIP